MDLQVRLPNGKIVPLDTESVMIGSDPSCDCPVQGGEVHPHHASLRPISGRWLCESMGDWLIQIGDGAPSKGGWVSANATIRLAPSGPSVTVQRHSVMSKRGSAAAPGSNRSPGKSEAEPPAAMIRPADFADGHWYYDLGTIELGPVNFAELKRLVAAGQLDSRDRIKHEKQSAWFPANRMQGLFPADGNASGAAASGAKTAAAAHHTSSADRPTRSGSARSDDKDAAQPRMLITMIVAASVIVLLLVGIVLIRSAGAKPGPEIDLLDPVARSAWFCEQNQRIAAISNRRDREAEKQLLNEELNSLIDSKIKLILQTESCSSRELRFKVDSGGCVRYQFDKRTFVVDQDLSPEFFRSLLPGDKFFGHGIVEAINTDQIELTAIEPTEQRAGR